ncbi:MAG: hypothetical protein EKK62_12915 [Acidimicrobiia bacterium]|nr:MAG: hypothetical protein EKK62_12915 [Acidimicrobiia bacterium]
MKNKTVRTVLYLHETAMGHLKTEATRRGALAGIDVTPEGAARALVYQGLGLTPDGSRMGGGASSSPSPSPPASFAPPTLVEIRDRFEVMYLTIQRKELTNEQIWREMRDLVDRLDLEVLGREKVGGA